ncbi:MAG: hypothetical protein V3T58_08135 [Candidatus Hydrothermarchaeales archaeon]
MKLLARLSDGGSDSHDNNELVLGHNIIPIIRARENAVGEGDKDAWQRALQGRVHTQRAVALSRPGV